MEIFQNGLNWVIKDELDEKFLKDIKNFISNNLQYFLKDKKKYSTKGKNANQYWIKKMGKNPFYFSTPEFENIEKKFRKQILNRLRVCSLTKAEFVNLKLSSCWNVIGEKDSYHTVHNHCDGRLTGISCVLYLSVPEDSQEEEYSHSNQIFLIMGSTPSSLYLKSSIPDVLHIDPKEGMLLIFPYHILHGTYPQLEGVRQTFNVDYEFILSNDNKKNIILNYV